MPPVPKKPVAHAKKVDIATLVGKIRLSYPILHASVVDSALQSLFIMKLAQKISLKGGTIVLPQIVRMHAVESDYFKEF